MTNIVNRLQTGENKKVATTVHLEQELIDAVNTLATDYEVSKSFIVNELLKEGLEVYNKELSSERKKAK